MTTPASHEKKIEDMDRTILRLMSERIEAAAARGEEGIDADAFRKAAEGTALGPDGAETVLKALKKATAEAEPIRSSSESRKICIIGGRGKMGIWLGDLFSAAGHSVTVVDKAPGCRGISAAAECDIVVIATPISSVSGILKELDGICGDQTIFDISSLKSPFIDVLADMGARRRVCSVHPMFGPGARSMYGRNLIVCGCGNADAVRTACELFEGRGANIVAMPVEEHDRYMSYVLGLSHAVNIAFFTVLERSGIPFEEFMSVASTTFRKNVDTNESVALEDPALYYEIQHLNSRSGKVWEEFSKAVKDVREASLSGHPDGFTDLMIRGREFFTPR
ncbi:MAG: prephenate dehydrogenase/arogenate dehydrogenase family protein [Candidatus Methanoplasma sp.]|jgi:chorismate mutase/prephenate dehydrogenase|nr:prephenate dehydrogenase/arogenate dehydrogenase family protein [Candidatus Methanoplasma sp.]